MKKICLLLIIVLCLSACACADVTGDPSNDILSAETSSDASSETSETVVCEEALKIDALLAGKVPDSHSAIKKYKVSRESGENGSYVDTDAFKLTDGISAEQFDTYTWVGFAGGTALTIDIDLGDDTHDIADIDIGCLRQTEYGIGLPGTAIIYASVDGTEYTKLGTIFTPTTLGDTACKYTYAFHFDKTLKARYIRLLFSSQECGWFFIDEITAKAYSSDFEAEGFEDCKSYGFDISCLQPNYSFMSVPDDDRLDSAALQAKMFGMSVEIEMSYYSDPLNIKRYKEYLQKGVEYGYMNSIKIYYLGIVPTDLTQAFDKGDEYARSAYKDTYLYAKNRLDKTYVASPLTTSDAPEDASFTTSGRLNGKIVINTSETYKMIITVSPRYGSIRLEPDGSFAYYPLNGYVGMDSFSVAAVFDNTISSTAVIEIECK